MRSAFWRSWLPLLLFLLTLTLLVLHETQALRSVENGLQLVFAPLQRFTSTLVDRAGGLFHTARQVRELEAQVQQLQDQVDALSVENIRLQTFEAEVTQLRDLLGFAATNPTWTFMGADVVGREACAQAPCGEVIGQEPNPYLRYFTINAGAEEGVAVGMPVVAGGAVLVGRVAEVGPHTAKVQLLSDTASDVAAMLQQSQATGVVAGQPDGSLRMLYIPQDEPLEVGDVVLTSGLGGGLPRGLVIGQVAEVYRQDVALFQEAAIRPAVDYRRVGLLLVITSFQPLVEEGPETGVQP